MIPMLLVEVTRLSRSRTREVAGRSYENRLRREQAGRRVRPACARRAPSGHDNLPRSDRNGFRVPESFKDRCRPTILSWVGSPARLESGAALRGLPSRGEWRKAQEDAESTGTQFVHRPCVSFRRGPSGLRKRWRQHELDSRSRLPVVRGLAGQGVDRGVRRRRGQGRDQDVRRWPRWFVVRDAHVSSMPVLLHPRRPMTLMRGPMTRKEIREARGEGT